MSLAACGTTGRDRVPAEPLVVVQTVKDTPPSELTRCPVAPQGLPTTGQALIPPEWRNGIKRLAKSRGDLAEQLGRLIAWNTGETCPQGD
jgi:hypothetical protein